MKLIRLKVFEEFRGLKSRDFEVNFHNEETDKELFEFHPFCLVGANGSGKSNVLEALANIFHHLECCTNDYPSYAFKKNESLPDSYELEYFITSSGNNNKIAELNRIKISKIAKHPPTVSVNGSEQMEILRGSASSFLPDLVVAYSSGENEILSLPFIKMKLFQYDAYLKDYIGKIRYEKPSSSLLYIDYEMSQAVLLTILLFFDSDNVLKTLQEELGIIGMQQFTINLKNNWQKLVANDDAHYQVETVTDENYFKDFNSSEKYIGRILGHLKLQINKLKECATCSFVKEDYISLDFWIDDNVKKQIRKKFKNDPYKFFSIFQMLQALNERVEGITEKKEIYNSKGYYTDYKKEELPWVFYFTNYLIKQKVKSTGEVKNLLLKQLSDGEQQFLHTLGICLMLQNKRSLLLLDEPETHFNPDWRSKFINILRKTLEAGGDNFLMKDIVLTSHSPFIISDCLPDKVIIFNKGQQPLNPDFNTFGTSTDVITELIFNNSQTIGDYAKSKLQKIDFANLKSEKDFDNAKNQVSILGDSIEKDLTLLRLNKLKKNKD